MSHASRLFSKWFSSHTLWPQFQSTLSAKAENFPGSSNAGSFLPNSSSLKLMSFFQHFTTSSKEKQGHIFQPHLEISAKYPSVSITSSSFSPIGRKQYGQVFCHFKTRQPFFQGPVIYSPFPLGDLCLRSLCFYFLFLGVICSYAELLKFIFSYSCCSIYPVLWNIQTI